MQTPGPALSCTALVMEARCANVSHSQPSRPMLRNQSPRPNLKNATRSGCALRCRDKIDAARFTCCLATATVAPPASVASAVQIHFSIPYRVNFGQAMCLLGSSEELGAWDVAGRVCSGTSAPTCNARTFDDNTHASSQTPHTCECMFRYRWTGVKGIFGRRR